MQGGVAATIPAAPAEETDRIPGTRKARTREVAGRRFDRFPVKSPLVRSGDDLGELIARLVADRREQGDLVAISESVVAISQGRALPAATIHIGLAAKLLWRFVRRVPYGIGLRSPETMQCAINEAGLPRILLASAVGALGKLVGRRGDFYRIAGMQAATIDAASTSPVPEFNNCVILGPKDPEGVAAKLSQRIGMPVAIVDVNDIGGSWVLGASQGVERKLLEDVLRDNPQGQGAEMTPFVLVRELK